MKVLAPSLLLVLAACSSGSSGPNAGTSRDFESSADAGPHRTATTRPLLGTSPRNLLLDPFVTADASWGHFVGVFHPLHTAPRRALLMRAYVSQAPAGVTVPVAVAPAIAALAPTATSLQIVAPLPGGSDSFDAGVWVSAGDDAGKPVAFESVAERVTVALLPNDQPTVTFPLTSSSAPVIFAGRPWVSLSLSNPVTMPQGGWFSITIDDPHVSLQIQAPEVTPTVALGPRTPPATAARRLHERTAPGAYVELTRQMPGL